MAKLSEKIIDLLEENGFTLSRIEEYPDFQPNPFQVEIGWYSPAGEDFHVSIWYDGTDTGFVDAFRKEADDFDAEEHAALWIPGRGKNGTPSSIRTLLDDADSIKAALVTTGEKLSSWSSAGRALDVSFGMVWQCYGTQFIRIPKEAGLNPDDKDGIREYLMAHWDEIPIPDMDGTIDYSDELDASIDIEAKAVEA